MSLLTNAIIAEALSTIIEPKIQTQINRAVVLAQILEVLPADGKNITWDVKLGTTKGAVIADGADVSVYNDDTYKAAVLQYGTYHDAFSITGKALSAAAATGSPAALANLFVEKMGDSVERLCDAIAYDMYNGDGSTDTIHGLFDGTITPIGTAGNYAGINSGTYTQWVGNVVDGASASLSFAKIRELRRDIYTASGEKPDLFITDPIQHDILGSLYGTQRRYVQEVRTASGVIKLDGGYMVLEFDGIPVIEDIKHPAGKFTALNTRHVKLRQLPPPPQAITGTMGTVQLQGTPEEQYGATKTRLTAHILPLAKTGDAHKFALYCYPQLQVRRRNACGFINTLAGS